MIMGGRNNAIVDLRDRVDQRGLDNVRVLWFVPNGELPEYLAACDVLLMPYQRRVTVNGGDTAAVMSPMKMFEYMAADRLIISSDLPVLREILDERNAVLCDPEDDLEWVEALKRAENDRNWREELARIAYQDAEKYTWRKRVRLVLKGILPGQDGIEPGLEDKRSV